jgi:hypothetical protein
VEQGNAQRTQADRRARHDGSRTSAETSHQDQRRDASARQRKTVPVGTVVVAPRYGSLDINLVKDALQELGTNLKMEDYSYSKGYKHDGGRWFADFISQNYGYERVVDLAGRGLEILRIIEDYTPAEIAQSRQRAVEKEKVEGAARGKISPDEAGTVVEQLRRAVADAFSAPRGD